MTQSGFRGQLRETVLGIAQRIVEAEGFEAAQARRIAREAECSVGSLYNVFGDIDGLILALNARTLGLLGEALAAAIAEAGDASLRQRLEALALCYLRFAEANHGRWAAVFRHRRAPGRDMPQSYLEDQAKLLALIEREIAPRLQDKGLCNLAARALFGSIHGIVTLAMDDRMGGTAQNDYAAQIRYIVGIAEKGLSTA